MGRDGSIGIANRYRLDGPGIESRWRARFSAPVQTDPGTHPASYTMGTESYLGRKRPGRDVYHPHHLAPRLKKEYSHTSTPPLGLRRLFYGELYLYLVLSTRYTEVCVMEVELHSFLISASDGGEWLTSQQGQHFLPLSGFDPRIFHSILWSTNRLSYPNFQLHIQEHSNKTDI